MLKRLISSLTTGSDFSKRIFLQHENQRISPWHDIPLPPNVNIQPLPVIIEIPRQNISKFEVCLSEEFNPIKQDTRKNRLTGVKELRHYARFPLFNYGMIPQTWENPFENDPRAGLAGDGDPLDVLDLGSQPVSCGQFISVKVLGAICLVDQGEVDWKILSINTSDPLSEHLNSPSDIDLHFPSRLEAIQDWFENIKVFDGKAKNQIKGPVLGPEETQEIIKEAHSNYLKLLSGQYPQAKVWLGSK